jgi:excisionase family DNA binding protein
MREFCSAYGISRSTAYKLMAEGRLKGVTVGAKRLIPTDAAEAWLASLGNNAPQNLAA